MSIRTAARLVAAAGLLFSGATASADIFGFSFIAPQPGVVPNNNGGTFHSIFATFDTNNKQLNWTVNFSDRVTKGYWLVINNGPNPKNHPGELGIYYFDANNVFDGDAGTNGIKLTAYGYNGQNASNSWQDGNSAVPGNQPGDLIKGANDTSWIQSIDAQNVVLPGGINGRSLSFTVDATDIIAHAPLYPDAVDPWYGTGFADQLGIWMHPARTFDVGYNGAGGISSFRTGQEGWLDGSHFDTLLIPAPGAAALAGVASILLSRRRRR